MSDAYVPMPMTCHPHYARMAEGIRKSLDTGGSLRVAEPRHLAAAFTSEEAPKPIADTPTRVRTLDVKECTGPAPFVGDPRMQRGAYFWKVAADDLGRHVASEAHLDIIWGVAP